MKRVPRSATSQKIGLAIAGKRISQVMGRLLKHWLKGSDNAEAVLDMGDIAPHHMGLSTSGKRLFDLRD